MNEEYTEKDKALMSIGIDTKEIQNNSAFVKSQYLMAFLTTPKDIIKKRPAKGGGTWSYVPVSWVIERLNQMFALLWSFEVVEEKVVGNEVIVRGFIEVPVKDGLSIRKHGFGSKEIQYKGTGLNKTTEPLSLGNDYKAAASDCLKKCATQLGIALDLYLDEIEVSRRDAIREQKQVQDRIKAKEELKTKLGE